MTNNILTNNNNNNSNNMNKVCAYIYICNNNNYNEYYRLCLSACLSIAIINN